jgi:phage-related minor tail protein
MPLGTLIVRIGADLTDLNKGLTKVDKDLQRLGKKATRAGKSLTMGLTLPLAAVGAASIKMASEAEESANKFNVVMGDSADAVRKRLEKLTETIPMTRFEMEAMAAGVQDMLVPMGLARDVGADMAASMVELAGDLGSFNNVGAEQVLEGIQSALAGSSEPMRKFGVDTRVTRLEALALEMGLIGAGEKLDNTSTALAVMEAIQRDSTDAMGDAARTVDSAANSFKFLWRDVKDLGVTIGNILLPAAVAITQKLIALANVFKDLSPTTQKMVVVIAAMAAAIGPLLLVTGMILTHLPLLKVGFAALTGPIGLGILAFGALALAGIAIVDNWNVISYETKRLYENIKMWLVDKFDALVAKIMAPVDKIKGLFKGMYDFVVGHSVVPDMIDGIAAEFARLDAVMVRPAEDAAAKVSAAFAAIAPPKMVLPDDPRALAEMFIPAAAMRGHGGKGPPGWVARGGDEPKDTLGTKVEQVLRGGGGEMGQLIQGFASFGPMAVVLPIINSAMESLAPVLKALMEPLKSVGRLFGAVMAPALRAITPVLRIVAKAFTYVVQAIGWFIEGLGKLIDKLIPDFISKAGQGIRDAGREMQEGARAARNGMDDVADAADKVSASLLNVPMAFNAALARWDIGGMAPGGGPSTPGGGGSHGGGGDGPGGTVNVTMNITQQPGEDGVELARRVVAGLKRMADSGDSMARQMVPSGAL